MDENKTFTLEKTVNYPIDKVYPQFSNLQNYTRWDDFFSSNDGLYINYFEPYEGIGSSLIYEGKKGEKGELYIRYANPNKTIKYQFFQQNNANPFQINLKFKALSPDKTQLIWDVVTPKQSYFKRPLNLFSENVFYNNINKSIINLGNLLGNKVDKDQKLASIKYDSLIIEDEPEMLLLGINVTTSNKKGALYPNIVLNHNKVFNYLTADLQKKEDEVGFPLIISEATNYKDKEVSYYLGIPVAKEMEIRDNNFSFKTVKPTKVYTIYYKGQYENRIRVIQHLITQAKKDELQIGELQQTFLENPETDKEVLIKISLSVY